ncbi:MAG TPA: hypothetical protein VMY37_20500 [Thermoguttaceae bacterium]|nr:hypothetical protein [Thermoguttaceae bacterium]
MPKTCQRKTTPAPIVADVTRILARDAPGEDTLHHLQKVVDAVLPCLDAADLVVLSSGLRLLWEDVCERQAELA